MLLDNRTTVEKITYKFLSAGEVKELDQAKVIPSDHVEAGMRDTGTVDVSFVCVPRPDPQYLVS